MKISKTAYKVLIIGTIINILTGLKYVWSLVGKELIANYGWTELEASLPYSVMTVVTVLWGIPAGRMGDYLAPKYGTMLGGVCMALGLAISAYTTNPIMMCISVGLFLGIASTSCTNNTGPTMMKWFPKEKAGLYVGIAAAGMGGSTIIFAPITNACLDVMGVTGTMLLYAALSLLLMCGLSIFFTTPPIVEEERKLRKELKAQGLSKAQINEEMAKRRGQGSSNTAKLYEEDYYTTIYHNQFDPMQALKKPEVYLLLLTYTACWMPNQTFNASLATIALNQLGWEDSYIAISMVGVGNVCGRIFSGWIGDKIGQLKTMMIVLMVSVVNMFLLSTCTSTVMFTVSCFLVGYVTGTSVTCLTYTGGAQVYGRRYATSINGWIALGYGIAGLVGPTIASTSYMSTGSYSITFYVCAAFAVLGVVFLALILKKYNRVVKEKKKGPNPFAAANKA